jgi:hypothetical protein
MERMGHGCPDNNPDSACHLLFGGTRDVEQDAAIWDIQMRLNRLEKDSQLAKQGMAQINVTLQTLAAELDSQEADLMTIRTTCENLNLAIDQLQLSTTGSVGFLQQEINDVLAMIHDGTIDIDTLYSLASKLQGTMDDLQMITNNNTKNIAVIQGYNNITEIVDPCGDGPGFDEIFLRLGDGRLVASFSDNANGLNTRFSVLNPNDSQLYITTDATSCVFKLPASGPNAKRVCWGTNYATCK